MSNSDGLPTKLCATCIQKTNAFFEFKCLIQDTDQKLRHMLNEQLMSDAQVNTQVFCDFLQTSDLIFLLKF